MKCIILAAGYATRLYPLTKNMPKPLLKVAGVSILDRIVHKIEPVKEIDEIILVSNHKFFLNFMRWSLSYKGAKKVTVLDDGTTSNENRLGAIKDIEFAVKQQAIHDDVMVLAGDNLFEFELTDFVDFFHEKKTDCITSHIIKNLERIKRTGVAELNQDGKLISFEEKPNEPKSNYAVPPFYIYRQSTIALIKEFLEEGNSGDAPGMYLSWLLKRKSIHAFLFEGDRYDIGTLKSYEEVEDIFQNNITHKGESNTI